MKAKREKLDFELIEVECENLNRIFGLTAKARTFVKFEVFGNFEPRTLELTHEVEEPETLKEFRDNHNLTKEELIEWLNENYK